MADGEVPAETEIRRGAPHREILASADDNDADLPVMATHGRTGLDRYLLGSVTETVVRMADVPVLPVSIPSEADEEWSSRRPAPSPAGISRAGGSDRWPSPGRTARRSRCFP